MKKINAKEKLEKAADRLKALTKKVFLKKRKRTLGGRLAVKARTTSGNWIKCKAKPIETDKIKVTRWGKFLGIFDFDEKYVEYENRRPTIYIDLENSKPFDYRTARKYLPLRDEKGKVVLETGVNPFQPKLQKELGFQFLSWKFLKPKATSGLIAVVIIIIIVLSIYQIMGNERIRKDLEELRETSIVPPTVCAPCDPCLLSWQDSCTSFSGMCEGIEGVGTL